MAITTDNPKPGMPYRLFSEPSMLKEVADAVKAERHCMAAKVRALVCDCEWGHADDCPQRVNAIADMIEREARDDG